MGKHVYFDGIDVLKRKLEKNATLKDVKRVVYENTKQLDETMKRNANFTKGYSIGDTKKSINFSLKNNGFTGVVAPKTEYAYYLEFGTRYMDKQPFVKPSFQTQKAKFKEDLGRLVE